MTQSNNEPILPPHDSETERALLGSMLIDPGLIPEVDAVLNADAFYQANHQVIYQAMIDLINERAPVDYITITRRISPEVSEIFDDLEIYLITLSTEVPTSINGLHYAKIIKENHQRRQIIQAASEIAQIGYSAEPGTDVISEAESLIFGLAGEQGPSATVHIKDAVREVIDIASGDREKPTGYKTGFIDLDRMMQLNKTDMVFVAGRPGMGKTALLTSMAEHAASKEHAKVCIFSLEMSTAQLATRMLARKARVNSRKITGAELGDAELVQLYEAAGELSQLPMMINPTAAISPSQLISQARRVQVLYGLDIVFIDYIQLMSPNNESRSRVQDIGSISRGLKQMAKELNVAVVAACQLSRAVEQRKDKRPSIADLRESGDLENDADAILLIYRDEYYNPDTTERANIAEINLAKHRHGPTGQVDLYWHGDLTSFKNLVRQEISL